MGNSFIAPNSSHLLLALSTKKVHWAVKSSAHFSLGDFRSPSASYGTFFAYQPVVHFHKTNLGANEEEGSTLLARESGALDEI